ncbi:DUF2268 domain-containing putative Zn-dependent protease [Viridibacillus arvi]|uniref:DUF2268 domain-containing protein n=1 Tax=Viridibacillus arvi TaxID=263475 RepID=UPI003D2CED6C
MSVIKTQPWLYEFIELCEEQSGKDASYIQCETLCGPLEGLKPKSTPEVWQYELQNYGLFEPYEWTNLKSTLKKLEDQKVWQIVEQEYQDLRRLWKGPKVSIYIFPIKNANMNPGKQTPNKNGVAYSGALFLFVSVDLPITELKALLAHEYNHVCRIKHLNLDSNKITLKDSLIIEGLGEYAVKDLYGEKWLGPWVNLYSFEDASAIWKRRFIPSLNVQDINNHYPFLYGKTRGPLPKWIGYHLGFQIVDSYQKNHGPFNKGELYYKTSDEIIAGSKFAIDE